MFVLWSLFLITSLCDTDCKFLLHHPYLYLLKLAKKKCNAVVLA